MTATLPTDYIGRFAPSPTGLLHIGSLLTALASYADARANRGKWLVRMEDLDPPREMPGAAAHILHTLEAFGFEWDGEVVWQSRRHSLYRDALGRLKEKGLLYPCYAAAKTGRRPPPKVPTDSFTTDAAAAPKTAPTPTNRPHGASASTTKPSDLTTVLSDITPKT